VEGQSTRLVVLDAASGASSFAAPCRGVAGITRDAVYVITPDSKLAKYGGGKEPLYVVPADLASASEVPVGWCAAGENAYAVMADTQSAYRRSLALVAYNASSGARIGRWILPFANVPERRVSLSEAAGGALCIAATEGLVKVRLPLEAGGVTVPAYYFRRPAGVIYMGNDAAATVTARRLTSAVIDGDLADWPEDFWREESPGAAPGAKTGLAFDTRGLLVGVRVPGQAGGAPRAAADLLPGNLRLTVCTRAKGAASDAVLRLDLLSIAGTKSPLFGWNDSVEVSERPNARGGRDYEILVPWNVLDTTPQAAAKGEWSITVGLSGLTGRGEYWSWPGNLEHLPQCFGRVVLPFPPGGQ